MKTLHELTLEVTAFLSWPEFAEAMDKGYVPTLRTEHPSPEPEDAEFNQSVSECSASIKKFFALPQLIGYRTMLVASTKRYPN